MRKFTLLTALILLGSCIPYSKYKLRLDYQRVLSQKNDSLNKEILFLKKSITDLVKEINNWDNEITIIEDEEDESQIIITNAAEIKLRLEKIGIKSKVTDTKLATIEHQLPNFTNKEISRLNPCKNPDTARNFNWLTQKEKDTYYWLNYARMYPKEFCDSFIIPNLKVRDDYSNQYIITLIDYMYSMKPLNALVPHKKAYESARCHAISGGKIGRVGHERLSSCEGYFSGECISYGFLSARNHIIHLLIDEDVPSLGHRYICLGLYNLVGISYAKHKYYDENVVMDFIFSDE